MQDLICAFELVLVLYLHTLAWLSFTSQTVIRYREAVLF
jgi:hypothetical protein